MPPKRSAAPAKQPSKPATIPRREQKNRRFQVHRSPPDADERAPGAAATRSIHSFDRMGENVPQPKEPGSDDPLAGSPPAGKGNRKALAPKTTNVPPRRSAARQAEAAPPPPPVAPPQAPQRGNRRGGRFLPSAAAAAADEEGDVSSSSPTPTPLVPLAAPSAVQPGRLRRRALRPAADVSAVPASPPAAAANAAVPPKRKIVTIGDVDAVIDTGRTLLITAPSSPPVATTDEDTATSPAPAPCSQSFSVRIGDNDTDELTLPNGCYVVSYDGEETVVTRAGTAEKGPKRKKHVMFSESPVAQFTPRDGPRKRQRVDIFGPEEKEAEQEGECSVAPTPALEPQVVIEAARKPATTASVAKMATATSSRVYGKRRSSAARAETAAARRLFASGEERKRRA